MSTKVGTSWRTAFLFHLPAILVLTTITIVPLAYNISISFHGFSLTVPGSRRLFVGLDNYRRLLLDHEYWNAMWVTARFVVISTALQLLLGLILALAIHSAAGKGQRVITSVAMIPMMVAPLVVGLMFSFVLNPQFGLYSYAADILGLKGLKAPLSRGGPALAVVILSDVWEWTPFMTLMILAALKAAPVEPYEAARMDGAGWRQILFRVTLPLIRPVVVVSVILRAIEAFKVFEAPFILTGGGPGNATEVIDMFTYREAFVDFNFSYAASLCIVLFVILLAAGVLYWRFVIRTHADD